MTDPEFAILQEGMVVQIDPAFDPGMFAGCFLIITRVEADGVEGYTRVLGTTHIGNAFAYVDKSHIELVGWAHWTHGALPTDWKRR